MFTRTEGFRIFIRLYPIVSIIIAIHLVLYLFTIMPFFPHYWFIETFSGVNLYIMQGELWRLITPTFMHDGFVHMFFNSFSLLLFGPPLERMLGSMKFLAVYLASGILANIATLLIEPLTYTHVGSSGAIFGIFGFYLSIMMFRKNSLSRQNSQIILTLCAISLIMTFIEPNINITGHIFGLIGGFLLGAISYFNKREFSGSIQGITSWAENKRKSLAYQPPFKLFIWGVIIIAALIGIFANR